jgi:hypothetical protein
MADTTAQKTSRRPLAFVLLGLALWAGAAYLFYDTSQQRSTLAPTPSAYIYNTAQSVKSNVNYQSNSFYQNGPGPTNTAYVAKLTDTIGATFHYAFRGSEATELRYQYDVRAVVRTTYSSTGNTDKAANVWNKQFQLLNPVSGTKTAKSFSVDPFVDIPYAQYFQLADQLRQGLSLPTNSETEITFTIRVSGTVGGTPFTDVKVASITAPLDQQVYQLATKYIRNDQQSVLPQQSKRIEDILAKYEFNVAIGVALVGFIAVIYGFRKQIFKSPYQRELERIYRYHDGIIVRASRPANLANKNIVAVQSFDDILNIEEEIKAPIIASPVGENATQFLIARDDIVYVYTLGDFASDAPGEPPTTTSAPASGQHKHPVVKRKVSG